MAGAVPRPDGWTTKVPGGGARDQWGVEALVRPRQHEAGSVGRDAETNATPGPIEQRLPSDQGAELLGSLVTGDPARERPEARALASRENDGPLVCPPAQECQGFPPVV